MKKSFTKSLPNHRRQQSWLLRLFHVVMTAVVVGLLFTGCGELPEKTLFGTWIDRDNTSPHRGKIEFQQDHKFVFTNYPNYYHMSKEQDAKAEEKWITLQGTWSYKNGSVSFYITGSSIPLEKINYPTPMSGPDDNGVYSAEAWQRPKPDVFGGILYNMCGFGKDIIFISFNIGDPDEPTFCYVHE